ncbi:hypothetical protein CONCODRAFT_3372 [Conidiobolus coronatus NRRL 28638]|uniref:Uncharacterized protein n=1 Tax=Conidiobolus coronatus (strain ATCC 28846 / CBS 209.66 / NRRL 28638) TaxID=796925 RepID=A0A137PFB1_CONC2|nr:hypothetical protein CONCODRAFT_3372 [Conidiobolus coronatus NRRL 28638]|eukprot:KXN73686.1 hypothetical protein CONCODRAFT_3372 [Conidiobolus coronatus NRRL 28638]
MKSLAVVTLVLQTLLLQVSGQVYYKKFIRNTDDSCEILEDSELNYFGDLKDDRDIKIFSKNQVITPFDSGLDNKIQPQIYETYSKNKEVSQDQLDRSCSKRKTTAQVSNKVRRADSNTEIRKVVDNGDPANRIDVVFMGDGYTLEQRNNFFDDIKRLTKDMFEGVTFKSWLPLFNIWAIHVPSAESGIGYNGPKNTPFKLYREHGQLRVIYPGDEDFARATCKLTGPGGCDYPSLIANDNYYGGVGGEFVVSTRSERTGTFVLRHEMGHSFIDTGDEYDNSWAYSGVNSADSLDKVGWKKWLTGPLREEREIYRMLEYPWHDLSKGPKSYNFTSDGAYHRHFLQVSVSAAGEQDSLEFLLDGKPLPWKSRGSDDREFYGWEGDYGFSKGQHTFSVRSKTPSTNKDVPRMIASVTLHEYGNEKEFRDSNSHYSAYPVWDVDRVKRLRPTKDYCLMRNITSANFCNVCKEGMWYSFLSKITLIDDVKVKNHIATVSPVKLGKLRPQNQRIKGENLKIRWYRDGVHHWFYNDLLQVPVYSGNWNVTVQLETPEVRSDPKNLLTSTKSFKV